MESTNTEQDNLVDITNLLRNCASQCLSYSHPFTPIHDDAASLPAFGSGGNDDDGTTRDLGDVLQVRGLSLEDSSSSAVERVAVEEDAGDTFTNETIRSAVATVNLRDAMSALEIGDKRMDCCEIPYEPSSTVPAQNGHAVEHHTPCKNDKFQGYQTQHDIITFPPRIAPKNLSDGTPLEPPEDCPDSHTHKPTIPTHEPPSQTLFVPTSPCPSLLPYWTTLSLSPTSPTSLLPLILLQFTALEAYIGIDSGGSNAAETLYCMLWCHEGVVSDMAERLNVWTVLETEVDGGGDEEEGTVAQWALFASTLGVVRIAEAVRSIVVDADIYEEENFGPDAFGNILTLSRVEIDKIDSPLDASDQEEDPTNICSGLNRENRLVNNLWDVAISKLKQYQLSCTDESARSTIEALVLILQTQQSFFLAIQMLYNLNDKNVVVSNRRAMEYSRETVRLLKRLRSNLFVERYAKHGLIESDGRLCDVTWLSGHLENQACRMFLSASYDPFVNRRSLGNAPIRKARFRQIFHVIDSISNLTSELEWAVCDVMLNGNTLGRITRMLTNNSLRGSEGAGVVPAPPTGGPSPHVGTNILSRSLLLINLYFDDKLLGQYDFTDLIGQHMVQLCAVPESMIESTGSWLARLAKPLYDTLKALCLDRHRERTWTESILLPAFGALQTEAASMDEIFRGAHCLHPSSTPAYATNYIIVQTLRLMERYVGLGIELGLYPHWYDLSQAYWYRDFTLTALINVQSTIEKERIERKLLELQVNMEHEEEEKKNALSQQNSNQKKGGGGKKKKGKKPKGLASSPATAANPHTSAMDAISKMSEESLEDRIEFTAFTLHRSLCRGMVRLIAALRQAKLLKDPPASMTFFTTNRKRFEKRFEVFGNLPQPPSLSFDDYETGSDFSAVNDRDLIASARDCFRMGKSVVDRLLDVILPSDTTAALSGIEQRKDNDLFVSIRRDEVMALAKVCVSNSLFLLKLETALEGQKPEELSSLIFDTHKAYCTVTT